MSLSSMTGFARIEGSYEGWTWAWEARSVNGRGLDIRMRLPGGFEALEAQVRAVAKSTLRRGNVQVSLQYERGEGGAERVVHEDIARQMVVALQPLVIDGLARPASVDGLLGVRGIVDVPRIGDTPEALSLIQEAMAEGIEPLFAALSAARNIEGDATEKVIASALDEIEALTRRARDCASAQPTAIKQKLQDQISILLDGQGFNADRLTQEAALLAIKADVREELDRLDAHITAGRALLAGEGPVGRKLEFLAQELNREANTLCAKSSDMHLTEIGLALKTTIDQVKEQAANVE